MNYATRMFQEYATALKMGSDCYIAYQTAVDVAGWAQENEQILSKNTSVFNKHLPTNFVHTIGPAYDNYFTAEKYSVPTPSWLSFNLENKNHLKPTLDISSCIDQKILELKKGNDSNQRDDSECDDPGSTQCLQTYEHTN